MGWYDGDDVGRAWAKGQLQSIWKRYSETITTLRQVVLLHPTDPELASALTHACPAVLVCGPSTAQALRPDGITLVLLPSDDPARPCDMPLCAWAFETLAEPHGLPATVSPPQPEDVALHLYPPALTPGPPRRITLTHGNCVAALAGYQDLLRCGAGDCLAPAPPAPLPVSLLVETLVLRMGGTVVWPPPHHRNRTPPPGPSPTLAIAQTRFWVQQYRDAGLRDLQRPRWRRWLHRRAFQSACRCLSRGHRPPLFSRWGLARDPRYRRVRLFVGVGDVMPRAVQEWLWVTYRCPAVTCFVAPQAAYTGLFSPPRLGVPGALVPFVCTEVAFWQAAGHVPEVCVRGPSVRVGALLNGVPCICGPDAAASSGVGMRRLFRSPAAVPCRAVEAVQCRSPLRVQ